MAVRLTAAMLLATAAAAVAGCASSTGVSATGTEGGAETDPARGAVIVVSDDVLAVVPRDFEVDVLVLAGPLHAPGDRVDERPLRLTISPDGSLHAATDQGVSGRTVPPRIRTLDRRALADVWTSARTLGLMDPDVAAPPVLPASVTPAIDELVAVVSIRADGRHRSIIDRVGGPRRLDRDLSTFIRRLADLAWANDRPDEAVRVVPRRYELGDDPYARYRRPGVGTGAGAGVE